MVHQLRPGPRNLLYRRLAGFPRFLSTAQVQPGIASNNELFREF